ncbi:MAG: FAD-binding protein, partial [Lachnospiraceae bacterium]|nr:FAD-binding protein [Lachnospiraceae bacterium]
MRIYKKELMKNFTSFRIGGEADIIAEPKDIKELVELIKFLRNKGIIFYILGNGTNVLVSDKGIRGCVVHIGKNLSKSKVNGTKIEAEAGTLLSDIAQLALKNKLQGFEQLSGIPGSIGGAVAMNTGAYDREIKDVVASVNAINDQGRVVKLTKDALDFSYRRSVILEKGFIITSVTINLQSGDKNEIKANMEKYDTLRKNKQPL